MYIIAVYDVNEKRVNKMLKLFRKYLHWIQNSVFEGDITEVKLKELQQKAKGIMDEEEDSMIVFKSRDEKWLEKEITGTDKNPVDNFLWENGKIVKRVKFNFPKVSGLAGFQRWRYFLTNFLKVLVKYLLYGAKGVTADVIDKEAVKWNFRTTPSGGSLYPTELYFLSFNVKEIESGMYFYNCINHSAH